MGKVTEKDIAAFTSDFADLVCVADISLLVDDECEPYSHSMRWGQRKINLYDASSLFADEIIERAEHTKEDVREFCGDDKCIAYMCCEGTLYETLYNYEARGYGGEDAEKMYNALMSFSDKYGMMPVWNGGAVIFYDKEDYLND